MRRRTRLIAAGILAVIGVGAVALALSRTTISRAIDASLRAGAAARGVRLTTRDLAIFPIGLQATQIDGYLIRYLLSLTAENVSARLTDLTPTVTVVGEAYGGSLSGAVASPWFSKKLSGRVTVSDLDLTRHPQLNALGISGGKLRLTLQDVVLDRATQRTERARFETTIAGFSRTEPFVIPPGRFGSPFGFTVPPIPPTDITATGDFSGTRVQLARLTVSTPLGELSASGEIGLERTEPVMLDALLSLTPEGAQTVGPFLPLVSEGAVDATATKIRVVVRGTLATPRIKWSRAG